MRRSAPRKRRGGREAGYVWIKILARSSGATARRATATPTPAARTILHTSGDATCREEEDGKASDAVSEAGREGLPPAPGGAWLIPSRNASPSGLAPTARTVPARRRDRCALSPVGVTISSHPRRK